MRNLFFSFLVGCICAASTISQVSGSVWVFPPQHSVQWEGPDTTAADLTGGNTATFHEEHANQHDMDYDNANWTAYLHATEVPSMDEYKALQKDLRAESTALESKLDQKVADLEKRVTESLGKITQDAIAVAQRDALRKEILDAVQKEIDEMKKEILDDIHKKQ